MDSNGQFDRRQFEYLDPSEGPGFTDRPEDGHGVGSFGEQLVGVASAWLPEAIARYLIAHQARDLDTAMARYTADAVVTDEGRTYRGAEEIRAWLATSAVEYTYTVELTGALRIDDGHYDARHHLAGNFPGGVADLHFRFTLRDGLITRLVIEP